MSDTTKATLTESEFNKIIQLNTKSETLNELFITLARGGLTERENNDIYLRLCEDLTNNKLEARSYWSNLIAKYSLAEKPNHQWYIDYSKREITLVPIACNNI